MDIKWITENYIESQDECIDWLLQFEKDGCYTKEQLLEGCKELRKSETEKSSIFTHLKLLHEMGKVGINASIAGEKIREALLLSKLR
jgi:hypothetical protein